MHAPSALLRLGAVVAGAVLVGAIGAGVAGIATRAPRPAVCGPAQELLGTVSALDRVGAAVLGSLTSCEEVELGRLTVSNATPVVWSIPARSTDPRMRLRSTLPAASMLAGFWERTGRGAVLPPGTSVRTPDDHGTFAWEPDLQATRMYVTLQTILEGQAEAVGGLGPWLDVEGGGIYSAAALACAAAVNDGTGAMPAVDPLGPAAIREALQLARTDVACDHAWQRASDAAAAEGWTLPPIGRHFDPAAGRQSAEAATAWFRLSRGFTWRAAVGTG